MIEITLGCNTFRNVELFEAFLRENLRRDYYDLDAFLNDVADDHGTTGSCGYELGSRYTKSRNPEHMSYDVEYIEDEGGNFESVYTFY